MGSLEPDHLLLGSASTITALFADDKGGLFSGNSCGQIIWWNLDTHRPFIEWRAHDKSVLVIRFIPCLGAYLSQGRDGLIKFWRLDSVTHSYSQILSSLTTSELTFCRLTLWNSSDDLTSTLCHLVQDKSAKEKLEVVKFPSHTICYELEASVKQKLGMCMVLQGWEHYVLAGYESGYLVLFDLHQATSTRNCQVLAEQITDSTIMTMSFFPPSSRGVVGTAETEHVVVFSLDVGSTNEITILKRVIVTNPGIGCAAWRPDGQLFATGGWDGRVRVFSGRGGCKCLAVLDWSNVVCLDGDDVGGPKSDAVKSVQCVIFTKERFLVSAGGDRSICVWNVFRDS